MAIKTFKYFDAGIGFKDQAADSITTNGVIYRNGNFLKIYIQSAVREIVTSSQVQTLTNKTIDASLNTITNIPVTAITGIIDTDLNTVSVLDDTIPSAKATKAYVDAQLLTKDAANEIAFTPAGTIASANVQAAVEEVSGDVETHKGLATGAHAASAISNVPAGAIAATTVQAAINELDTEKVATTVTVNGHALSANVTVTQADVGLGNVDNTSDTTKNAAAVSLTNKTINASLNTISNITNTEISASAAIARTKLANGTNNALQANSATGVLSDISDITVGTNNFTLAATKHLELTAATDATTTGSNASLTAFTGSAIRLTNGSLLSLANIPAGAEGQELAIFNRTGVDLSVIDQSGAVGTAANRIFTGTSGNITFTKDAALLLRYDSVSARWQIIGGTGGAGAGISNVNIMSADQADNSSLTDYTQTGLELVTSPVLHGTKSFRLQHATSIKSFKKVIAVDKKFRGKNHTVTLDVVSSATSGNLNILFYDETNAANLAVSQTIATNSQAITATTANASASLTGLDSATFNKLKVGMLITGSAIPVGTTITALTSSTLTATLSAAATGVSTGIRISDLPATKTFSFDVPANCLNLSWTISSVVEAAAESYIDDVVVQLTSTALTSTSISQQTTSIDNLTMNVSGTLTALTGNLRFGAITNTNNGVLTYSDSTGYFTASKDCYVTIGSSLDVVTASGIYQLNKNGVIVEASNHTPNLTDYVAVLSANIKLLAGEYFNFSSTATIGQSNARNAITILATAYTTTSTTIPLTTAQLVQQSDSYLKLNTSAGNSSTNTFIRTFTNVETSIGDAFTYTKDAVLGDTLTVKYSGNYSVNFVDSVSVSGIYFAIVKNLSTNASPVTLSNLNVLAMSTSENAGGYLDNVSFNGYLNAGDVLRFYNSSTTINAGTAAYINITASYQGSLKQLNPSSDSKITIPTHQLRFEGASARGTGAEAATVQYTSQTLLQGDAWVVSNSNGTVITMKKAGKLTVSTNIYSPTAGTEAYITKNASSPSAIPSLTSEIMNGSYANIAEFNETNATFDVVVGDIIRVSATNTPTARFSSMLSLSLTETSIPANFSNVLPQWSQSDSAIELNTANGFGSTATTARRFSNTTVNLGSSMSYVDSATLGATITINEDSDYTFTYTDSAAAAFDLFIKVNGSNRANTSVTGANFRGTAVFSGYLLKNDVVTFVNTQATTGNTPAETRLTAMKVGKPNLTSVDVTPFVNMKTTDVEAIEFSAAGSGFGSSFTNNLVFSSPRKFTNLGVISIVTDTTGTYFQALKSCTFNMSYSGTYCSASESLVFTRNQAAASPAVSERLLTTAYSVNSEVEGSVSLALNTGDKIRIYLSNTSVTRTTETLNIIATADNNATAAPTQQVSSDTMNFVFQSTALTGNESVGTFNTYTYAANTNTATIATSAPTQTTSSMNVNGVQVFARAFNTTSTSASPCRFDIFIGKGLKSKQVDSYAGLAKTIARTYDYAIISATSEAGTHTLYNEVTGILTIDAGLSGTASAGTSRIVSSVYSDTSAYFVINASKSPSLVTIPNLTQRIAYLSDQKASGTAGGSSVALTQNIRTLNTIIDSTGIVTSLASNQFVLPAGTYNVEASAPSVASNSNKLRLRNVTDSTTSIIGQSEYNQASSIVQVRSFLSGEVTITSSKTFQLEHYTTTARATDGLGVQTTTGENEVYAQVKITKVR